ncbi:homocysteine S-methyltransferase [Streptosporangium roseum]|uniref:S-methylmethionine:homocysteine methyltransferase n=1 Tax=Streptosporangium roseum (strain ATCC 12428 / DSM 43021 / JCM 3005 / KCTC 9067 / NCIMB 10171 / NRRL 2505 / NI 9100) TaxID=479432 RepID=D2B6D6_STRRD|nr:homocysteine S-methyltransferase [Streptosporangium roseum]ACZ85700.1 homocysteine methyltransferase [Streptosporangium roseum DSM 43021]
MVILDGGLATHLEALGADLRDELWSAKLLLENPSVIRQAHLDYFTAGAEVATTASYQASIPAFVRRGLSAREAEELIVLSVRLAAEARDSHGTGTVAASVGPYGAYLANGAEYTGDYDLDEDGLADWHRDRWHILAGSGADLLACETIPSYAEARALGRLLAETPGTRAWVSFSCRDGEHISDGTPLKDAAALFAGNPQVIAVGVNCTAPRHITSLIGRIEGKPVMVYPNSGETWDAANRRWLGLADPAEFGAAAAGWHAAGSAFVGGCCRTTPEHIRQIGEHLKAG